MVLRILSSVNYGCVLVFGTLLSAEISGGCETPRQKRLVALMCPVFLALQVLLHAVFGLETVKKLYPVIVHLPLMLLLVFALKRTIGVALVSVYTAYLCCELPNWVRMVVAMAARSELAGQICYTVLIVPLFFILRRYFVRAAHEAMTCSRAALWLFGALPVAYYFFDYATTIYSNALYSGVRAINESLPALLIAFYVAFLTAYHAQAERSYQAELQSSMLEVKWSQAQTQMNTLRRVQTQTAVYQHDMRHHLTMLEGLIAAGKPEQAAAYIRKVQSDIETITPRRYCENELVSLLCSSFAEKAQHAGAARCRRKASAGAWYFGRRAVRRAVKRARKRTARRRRTTGKRAHSLALLRSPARKAPHRGQKPLRRGAHPLAGRPPRHRAQGARLRLPEHPDHRRTLRRSVRVQSQLRHILPPDRPAVESRRAGLSIKKP